MFVCPRCLQELSLQEGGALSGGAAEYPREYSNLTPSQSDSTPKRVGIPPEKKEEGASSRGSLRTKNYEISPGSRNDKRSGSGAYSRVQRVPGGNFMMSPARSSTLGRSAEFGGSGAGFGHGFDRGPHGGEGTGRSGRDHFYPRDYRDHYGSYGDHNVYLRGHGFAGEFDRHPYPHPDWRRSYAGGEFDHASPYSGRRGMYGDMHGVGGRYDHGGFDPHHHGGRFGTRRDRLMMEEARLLRVKSHERMEHLGGVRFRPEEEFREPPMDFYLSQPTTPHFPPDRSLGFNIPPPPGMTMTSLLFHKQQNYNTV